MGDIRQCFKPKTLHLEARLPASMSMGTIHAVDKQLKARNTEATNNRGPYIKVSDEEKGKIGSYAAKHRVTAAIRYFRRNQEYLDLAKK